MALNESIKKKYNDFKKDYDNTGNSTHKSSTTSIDDILKELKKMMEDCKELKEAFEKITNPVSMDAKNQSGGVDFKKRLAAELTKFAVNGGKSYVKYLAREAANPER